MPVARPTSEHMEKVVAGMRETIRARQQAAPDPVNLEAAESLFDAIPLRWGAVEYGVKIISYREGLRLQRLNMRFRHLSMQEVRQESDVDAHDQALEEILTLFHSLLDPKPAVNPFEDATPLEVGSLAAFFYACQRIQSRPVSSTPAMALRSLSIT